MVKYIIAKQLVGKRVVTSDGFDLGRFLDAEVSEVTGKIINLLIEPNPDSTIANKVKQEDNQIKVPYNALTAVNDFMVIDRKFI
jgi:sporulation protein YlmC with PRC-barrel domain